MSVRTLDRICLVLEVLTILAVLFGGVLWLLR